ncbi:allergen Tha p 1-like [Maniola jurtina]|uniref:allergen Tha p 1-like n=1 Tax=Maniola jurtina TaxID=191418 RepID=UPI001E68AF89|nr:allergen Tha p 1-like [Maniola jurtina]
MKAITLFALFTLAATEVDYHTGNNTLELEAFVSDITRVKSLVDCFLDREPCHEPAGTYKALIPKILATKCDKCTNEFKHLAYRFLTELKASLYDEYLDLRYKYDRVNQHYDDFVKAIEACKQLVWRYYCDS